MMAHRFDVRWLLPALFCLQICPWVHAQTPMSSRDVNKVGFVAVVDLQRLLKDYGPFNERLKQLDTAAEERSAFIAEHQAEARRMRERLKVYQTGSIEHRHMLSKVRLKEAHIAVEEEGLDHAINTAKARLHVAFYRVVRKEIESFANAKGITLVLNSHRIVKDASNVLEAEALFQQKVVFQNNIDITGDILDALDERKSGTPAAVTLPQFDMPPLVALTQETDQ